MEILGGPGRGSSRASRALPQASNQGLSGRTTISADASFSRSASCIAALRLTPPINSTRRNSRWLRSSSDATLLAMLSCSVCRMSSGLASRRFSLWVMSDLQ
jgi:hypothetical protein